MLKPADCRRLADETDDNLRRHVLGKWFPAAVDSGIGGFAQNFTEDWTKRDDGRRGVVFQARLTWLAAQAARRFPEMAPAFLGHTRHGMDFLADRLWDRTGGGFFWEVGPAGPGRNGEKHAYGVSFALYAATANYEATRDGRALDLAQRAFAWLEAHAHDARNGGYYEALDRDGKSILTPPDGGGTADAIGTRWGHKSMNTHIHLLEAFTALYEVWPDAKVRARLDEVFGIVRDRIAADAGYLNLFFTPEWRVVPDHDSYGHDVETAYLLLESAAALGRREDARTLLVARRLVDHALSYGWDTENGGFYDTGNLAGKPINTDKIWWTQAEGLNALLLMHVKHDDEKSSRYGEAFARQWEFIQKKQIDARHGGWFPTVTRDGKPIPGQPKSDGWTEGYHQGRALLNVSATLRRLGGKVPVGGAQP